MAIQVEVPTTYLCIFIPIIIPHILENRKYSRALLEGNLLCENYGILHLTLFTTNHNYFRQSCRLFIDVDV